MDHTFQKLKAHILPRSVAPSFEAARHEWQLVGVYISEEWDQCPCGHPIKELCYIENQLNRYRTYVGNVCVNRFLGISTGNLFAGLKRIAENIEANANEDLIVHAFRMGYIYENEYSFLMSTKRKRQLSEKQLSWKVKINRRILRQAVVRQPST